ncbi:3238_t:CDS:2 [Cetraspora pellucida]|uniref:3238_t:CDS:1 n=1 Tax=Cetraspora pellucida TaxID=1433469 RepID=A0A9N8VP67_9GLOM|nr:3238_t:CDS:2 [Cetraspora pellucida]
MPSKNTKPVPQHILDANSAPENSENETSCEKTNQLAYNKQSDDEFDEFDNKEFDPNQISIYQATSIAESTEIEVSKEIVAVKKRRTEELDPKKLFYENVYFLVKNYKRKQKKLTEKNKLTAYEY